ncbi:MAG TPA: recombinase family protein [Solirubrobacteraceae bacterium]|nr:recombinase family protein [Solirubrobacteraceae bacterium]
MARVPVGYDRSNGTLSPNPDEVPIAQRAFKMRADGESITQIRNMLKSHGIERSHRGVQVMLANRIYLGELHFGKLVNLAACEPIIERELFDRVQRMFIPRGRKPKSTRLLARLGVLRCGSCGARLSAMKLPKQNDYPIYRCPSTSDCDHHVTISAVIAERVVVEATRAALRDIEGRADAQANARQAREDLAVAEAARDAAISAFDGLGDLQAAKDRLAQLQAAVDGAQERVAGLGDTETALTINGDRDWDLLTADERRALIRATVERASVRPGRGPDRIAIELFV